ncbi:MAG: hypothetical protein K0R28_3509 [Paenibacillus sp.]|nr:hypothetical protein [Paenibacillus sp.]
MTVWTRSKESRSPISISSGWPDRPVRGSANRPAGQYNYLSIRDLNGHKIPYKDKLTYLPSGDYRKYNGDYEDIFHAAHVLHEVTGGIENVGLYFMYNRCPEQIRLDVTDLDGIVYTTVQDMQHMRYLPAYMLRSNVLNGLMKNQVYVYRTIFERCAIGPGIRSFLLYRRKQIFGQQRRLRRRGFDVCPKRAWRRAHFAERNQVQAEGVRQRRVEHRPAPLVGDRRKLKKAKERFGIQKEVGEMCVKRSG